MKRLLETVGLCIRATYGDFDGSEFTTGVEAHDYSCGEVGVMPIFGRFVRYLTPHTVGQIIFGGSVCGCNLDLCTYGFIHIHSGDDRPPCKLIKTEGFAGENRLSFVIFKFEGFFDGIPEITIAHDKRDALQLVSPGSHKYFNLSLSPKESSRFVMIILMSRVGHKLVIRVRDELYAKHTFSAPLGVLREHRTGDLMSRVIDDVRTWLNGIGTTAPTIRAIVTVPVFVCVMSYCSPRTSS